MGSTDVDSALAQTASAERHDEIVTVDWCVSRPYLELTIPYDIQRVQKISVRVSSHDQGFCDNPSQGCWSFLHINVITPAGRPRFKPAWEKWPVPLYNDIANKQYQEHHWILDSSSSDDPVVHRELDSVRPGDTVQIVPVARFLGWATYVNQAKIEVFGHSIAQPDADGYKSLADFSTPAALLFEPLAPSTREIRLLRLRSGGPEDAVVGQLQHVSLDDPGRASYEALSYCWGEKLQSKVIRLASRDQGSALSNFLVSENLYGALRQLRRPTGEDRLLWIDALCINQDDLEERAQQVGIMRIIYSEADTVVVWLGACDDEMQTAVDGLSRILERQLLREADDNERQKPLEVLEDHEIKTDAWLFNLQTPLLSAEYFSRTWVLQEVYNARRIAVQCGKNELSWASLLRVDACLSRVGYRRSPALHPKMPTLFSTFFELAKYRRGEPLTYVRKSKRSNILDVFVDGISLGATDPRDKIFALLSFGLETYSLSQLPKLIAPDYTKSTSQVFAHFTLWWIQEHMSLRILSAIHLSSGRTWCLMGPAPTTFPQPDRPSWSLWHDGSDRWTYANLGLYPSYPWMRAALDTRPDLSLLMESSETLLKLRGRIIASIESIDVFPYFFEYVDISEKGFPNGFVPEEMMQAYERTLDPLSLYGFWNSGSSELTSLRAGAPYRVKKNPRLGYHFGAHEEFTERTAGVECHQPCLLRTDRGGYGICPPDTRVGDRVVALDGGTVPFVLRAVKSQNSLQDVAESYTLVGECYLQDYMRGEAYATNDEGAERFPSTVFNLM